MPNREGDPAAIADELLAALQAQANPDNAAGMTRYGISPVGTLGVSMPQVRAFAREAKRAIRRDPHVAHETAEALWRSGVHEARILAALVDVSALVGKMQMEEWVADLDSWDVCDQLCGNLFDKTAFAWEKAAEWAGREPEFVKRAGFVLMTQLAVHDKSADDERFAAFLPLVEREAGDPRPFVKKAVNWALRQIGKRDASLHVLAVASAERILAEQADSPSARWIARDALRELRSDAVMARVAKTGRAS